LFLVLRERVDICGPNIEQLLSTFSLIYRFFLSLYDFVVFCFMVFILVFDLTMIFIWFCFGGMV